MGFLDRATQGGICGCGFVLQVDNHWYFKGRMAGGVGTKHMVEILNLWALLIFSLIHGVIDIKLFGDSKLIIDWITGKAIVKNSMLLQWGERTLECKRSFERIVFLHIYRELNLTADMLSKKSLHGTPGLVYFEEIIDNVVVSDSSLKLFTIVCFYYNKIKKLVNSNLVLSAYALLGHCTSTSYQEI